MKLERQSKDGFVFHLGRRERGMLIEAVQLYPLVPPARHRLSRTPRDSNDEENQRLLEEALKEHRQANRREAQAMLQDPACLRETENGALLTLTTAQVERLLQVLNDVRVGSWLALGEPDEDREPELTRENMRYVVALQVCGLFESALLSALGVEQSPEWH